MIKVFFLIFETELTWDRIVVAQRSIKKIFFLHLLPMVLIACIVEGAGMKHWGRIHPDIRRTIEFTRADVLLYEAFQLIFSVLVIFVCTRLVSLMGQTFRTRTTTREAFTAVAYGLSPMFLLRFGDALPQISPWATWGAGIALSIWILYQGLPRVMNPDPTHAFGLYLMTAMVLVLVTGLARLLTALYLMQHVRHIAADIKTFLPGVHF